MTPGLLALTAASLAFVGGSSAAYELAVRWRAWRLAAVAGGGAFVALVVMWLVVTGRLL